MRLSRSFFFCGSKVVQAWNVAFAEHARNEEIPLNPILGTVVAACALIGNQFSSLVPEHANFWNWANDDRDAAKIK